ncbi:MAG: T9SS type A sorting domain-containing protein [Ignavibacteria bacterium]|nr:T9SS type A sorting domain-containing protein [Ignavibacteria bacterium]
MSGDVDVYRKDLCGDTSCISIVSDTTYCDSSGTYFYEFTVHNNSPTRTVEQLEITVDSPHPPNYVVTVPSTLNVTIGPSGTSAVQRVRMIGPGAVARTEVCYTLSAQYMHDDCPWCCYIENCIKLPDCGSCVQVLSDSLYCSNNSYFYNFLLQNGTIYDVTKIQITSPGVDPVTFIPQIIHFATPIAPGQVFPNETVQVLGGVAGMTIPIRIKLFSDDFECCYIELSKTFSNCDSSTVIIQGNELKVDNYNLAQNYPNPFNPTTFISFAVPVESIVELNVYDISGRLIQNLINNVKYAQGIYSVKFDGSKLSSGMYYYRLKTNDYIATRKMVLIK